MTGKEIHNKVWKYLERAVTVEIDNYTEGHEEEHDTDDYPGCPAYVDVSAHLIFTFSRDNIGDMTDNEWEQLTDYVESQIVNIDNDMDFQDVFCESVLDWVQKTSSLDSYEISEYARNVITELSFKSNNGEWTVDCWYE